MGAADLQHDLLFRRAFEDAPIGMGLCSLEDGSYLRVNQALCHLLGRSEEELLGLRFNDVTHPEDAGSSDGRFARLRAGEIDRYDIEKRYMTKAGEVRWVDLRVSLVRSETGEPLFSLGQMVDITDRKRAEAELAGKREELRQILDATPALVYVKDLDGRYLEVNREFSAGLNLARSQVVGHLPSDFLAPEAARMVEAHHREVLEAGRPKTFEERHYRDGVARTWVSVKAPLRGEGGRIIGVCGVDTEITGRLEMEEEKAKLERQLERYERLEAVGQLAGGIAHDFNNLLAVILNYAALLEVELDDADLVELASEIRQAANRAAELTRDLLAIGRRSPVKRVALDPAELLDGVRSKAAGRFGDRIRLETSVSEGTPALLGDHDQVAQMLFALVQNAAEAMPGGGTVSIGASHAQVTAADGQPEPGHYVLLRVADSGAGMPDSVAARAFEPFFSTKPKSESAGLGLATVYGTVRRSGGHVQIRSRLGKGTTVEVHLPQAAGHAAPAPEPAARRDVKATVLLVDDEPALVRLGRRVLEGAGFVVLEASDPVEAVRVLDEHDGEVDLLATDVVMPGSSGIELARRVRESRPELPVLFMSGYPDEVIARVGELGDQDGFLAKPYAADELVQAARRALAG